MINRSKFLTPSFCHLCPRNGSPLMTHSCWPSFSFCSASSGRAACRDHWRMDSEVIATKKAVVWLWLIIYNFEFSLVIPIIESTYYQISVGICAILTLKDTINTWDSNAVPKAVDGLGRWWPQLPIQLSTEHRRTLGSMTHADESDSCKWGDKSWFTLTSVILEWQHHDWDSG